MLMGDFALAEAPDGTGVTMCSCRPDADARILSLRGGDFPGVGGCRSRP